MNQHPTEEGTGGSQLISSPELSKQLSYSPRRSFSGKCWIWIYINPALSPSLLLWIRNHHLGWDHAYLRYEKWLGLDGLEDPLRAFIRIPIKCKSHATGEEILSVLLENIEAWNCKYIRARIGMDLGAEGVPMQWNPEPSTEFGHFEFRIKFPIPSVSTPEQWNLQSFTAAIHSFLVFPFDTIKVFRMGHVQMGIVEELNQPTTFASLVVRMRIWNVGCVDAMAAAVHFQSHMQGRGFEHGKVKGYYMMLDSWQDMDQPWFLAPQSIQQIN